MLYKRYQQGGTISGIFLPQSAPFSSDETAEDEDDIPLLPISNGNEGNRPISKQSKVGDSIIADDLGPVIVNSDGTLRRIANWIDMTDAERLNTLEKISLRNKRRLNNMRKRKANQGEPAKFW